MKLNILHQSQLFYILLVLVTSFGLSRKSSGQNIYKNLKATMAYKFLQIFWPGDGLPRPKLDTKTNSFHWHVQNVTIPCHSQELLPFLSVIYFFPPLFSTNHTSILPHIILSSIS
jgi:hypothetical protein